MSVRVGIVGMGKMGISHLAILGAHPDVELVAGCDGFGYLTSVLEKYTGLPCYPDLDRMLAEHDVEALLIATPSKSHAELCRTALERGLHIFCEKPFVLDPADGTQLVDLAREKDRVTQVGYHYRFVGAFQEAARIAASGALGRVHHARVEAYGPVVVRPKGGTWRSSGSEGGGAIYDYACHAVDLLRFAHATPSDVSGVVRASVFSKDVDDEVYCSFRFPDGSSGQLAVNWSDESQRKMSTRLSLWGERGSLVADRQECRTYLRAPSEALPGYVEGWNVRYTTELTEPVDYYLRGEEYSAQIDHFVRRVRGGEGAAVNDFESALETDRVIARILGKEDDAAAPVRQRRRGFWSRLLGAWR